MTRREYKDAMRKKKGTKPFYTSGLFEQFGKGASYYLGMQVVEQLTNFLKDWF